MELELVYNEETQEWEQKPEPFITIECETEEDFEFIGTAVAFYKKHFEKQEKQQTNADRIRAMSDDELAKAIMDGWFGFGCDVCSECKAVKCTVECVRRCSDWLKQPAEDDHG